MLVELVGVPGCGKSTYVANYLQTGKAINALDIYLYNKSRIAQNINKILLTIYFFIKQPQYFISLYKVFRNITFATKTKFLKMFLYLYSVCGAIIKTRNNSWCEEIIVDEGVNQVIWGILYNSSNSENIILHLQELLFPLIGDKIIYLEVDKEIIKKRLEERNKAGGAELRKDIKKDKTKLDYAYKCMSFVYGGIEKLGIKERVLLV